MVMIGVRMLNASALVIGIPLLFGILQDAPPAGWMVFASKAGRFSVSLPGVPIEVPQFVGQLKVVKYVAEGKNEAVYVISHTDYAEADVKADAVQKRLDQARDGAIVSVGGKLKTEKAVQLEGFPGRDIAIEKAGAVIVRMRIFVVDRRVYQVLALGPPAVLGSKEVANFLDSFRLIK